MVEKEADCAEYRNEPANGTADNKSNDSGFEAAFEAFIDVIFEFAILVIFVSFVEGEFGFLGGVFRI